jgi:hypothetical protein
VVARRIWELAARVGGREFDRDSVEAIGRARALSIVVRKGSHGLWHNGLVHPSAMKLVGSLGFRFVCGLIAMPFYVATPALGAPAFLAVLAGAGGQQDGIEMTQTLYVQAPDFQDGGKSIVLVWLPEPLESTCLGRTMKECALIDFCIRTTNPNGPQCSHLGIPRAQLPHYPAGMQPRRAITVMLRFLDDTHGYDKLKAFYKSADPSSLRRLSSDATITARIRYNSGSFEGFTVLEVLSAP